VGGLRFKTSLVVGRGVSSPYLKKRQKKASMAVNVCNLSYVGGRSRRI
jgi:hypothetical protein